MNFKMILTIIFVFFAQTVCAAWLGGKGNMRGLLTRSSGLSPRQMILLRKQLHLIQQRKYGRFAWTSERFHLFIAVKTPYTSCTEKIKKCLIEFEIAVFLTKICQFLVCLKIVKYDKPRSANSWGFASTFQNFEKLLMHCFFFKIQKIARVFAWA